MFYSFFRKFEPIQSPQEPEPVLEPIQSVAEIIEEIHESFYTEVDRLLEEAKIANSLETDKEALIEKANRLRNLGFLNSKEVKDADKEIKRINNLERDNNNKKHLIQAINYFSTKYPNYKFITEKSVKKICQKYGLVYGSINKYVGTVPDVNLKHIEDFKISEDDMCYEKFHQGWRSDESQGFVSYQEYQKSQNKRKWIDDIPDLNKDRYTVYLLAQAAVNNYFFKKQELEIAAPVKDFDMEKSELKEFNISDKVEIPDPVVLHPVFFEGQKHYLVVTAWGEEAGDPDVVNEKMN